MTTTTFYFWMGVTSIVIVSDCYIQNILSFSSCVRVCVRERERKRERERERERARKRRYCARTHYLECVGACISLLTGVSKSYQSNCDHQTISENLKRGKRRAPRKNICLTFTFIFNFIVLSEPEDVLTKSSGFSGWMWIRRNRKRISIVWKDLRIVFRLLSTVNGFRQ